MWCWCTLIVLLVLESRTAHSSDVNHTQFAMCRIVADNLVATANATFTHGLKGVCTDTELDRHFQTLRVELHNKIDNMYKVILNTAEQLARLQEMVMKNIYENSTKPVHKILRSKFIRPRDLEFKENNNTVHLDNATEERVFSYYWKIEGMQDKLTTYNKQDTFCSPKFYVDGGYKMYIKMFSHQDKGNVYIHVGLANGKHDERLVWPFTLKHRVTVVDQSKDTTEDITSQIWDPTVLCSPSDWQRPSSTKDSEECVGFGFTMDTLLNNSYIFDDSLIIKLDVFI